jgi:glyoxylase-like metal-dependent hydrolase (beta-lactamase superfamily II)
LPRQDELKQIKAELIWADLNWHEIDPGLRRWTGWHPEWKAEVGSVWWQGADALCLIDPIVPPDSSQGIWSALDQEVERLGLPLHVFITIYWHARQAREVVERYGARLWSHEPAKATIERRAGPADVLFLPGDELPGGLEAFQARGSEVVYWIPEPRALVTGDVILGGKEDELALCPESWAPKGGGHAQVKKNLRALAGLPIERVLVSHGEPVLEGAREAFARLLVD